MALSTFTRNETSADGETWSNEKIDDELDAIATYLAEVKTKCGDITDTTNVDSDWTFGDVLMANGGFRVRRTAVASGAYTALSTDVIIAKTSITGGGDTITLPTASSAGAGKVYIFVDESGTAATNNITIDGNGGELINGATTQSISTNYGVLRVYSTGSAWIVW